MFAAHSHFMLDHNIVDYCVDCCRLVLAIVCDGYRLDSPGLTTCLQHIAISCSITILSTIVLIVVDSFWLSSTLVFAAHNQFIRKNVVIVASRTMI